MNTDEENLLCKEESDILIGKIMNYLKVTGYRLGCIINFKHEKWQLQRVVQ